MNGFEIKGKFNSAMVYTDHLEDAAFAQIQNLMNQKFAEGAKFAIMPDVHAGKGCVIGLTMKLVDKVVPNLVGVDINCGMLVVKVDKSFRMDLQKMDRIWHEEIPSGMNHREKKHANADYVEFEKLVTPVDAEKHKLSIGTLGGGNHFGEVDVDDEGNYYIVIHSGSRHLGVEVCNFHQKRAIQYHSAGRDKEKEIIARCKAEGRTSDIEKELKAFHETKAPVPNELAYLEGDYFADYINDMWIAQSFAALNRESMMDTVIESMGIPKDCILDSFTTKHNYIDIRNKILRKGAISLQKDEEAIIPMNMRDGSLIVKGKGNPEWNFSGPHGAGRIMSRSKAKEMLKMDDFKSSMEGIYTTCVSKSTIDESPMAYKPMEEIVENIKDTAEIVKVIKPIYNFKAGE